MIIGPGGTPIVEPFELDEMVEQHHRMAATKTAASAIYEAGRAYGRYEADNAITWMTSCVSCAKYLDVHAQGYFQGERSGLADALRAIQEARSADPEAQAVIDVIEAKVARRLALYREMEPTSLADYDARMAEYRKRLIGLGIITVPPDTPNCPQCGHVRAADCVTPEHP